MDVKQLLLFAALLGGTPPATFAETQQNAKVTLNMKNVSIKEIFDEIEHQTNYLFVIDDGVNLNKKVSVNVKSSTLKTLLSQILLRNGYTYEVKQHHIIVSKALDEIGETNNRRVQKVSLLNSRKNIVKGKVIDIKTGDPVIGANIRVVNNKLLNTISDVNGNFILKDISPDAELEISYIGYEDSYVKLNGRTTLSINLSEASKSLNEVVVVGYGSMKKKDLTGAVNSIKASDFTKEQPQTVQDMLRTGVAGMAVSMATDTKGNSSLLIRGKSTISGSTSPLVVLDGVIYPGEITDINPNDIERIDVLKDASSAAVYGAQAANGVVLITTKKGSSGTTKPVINFSATVGTSFLSELPNVYSGEDYLNFRKDVIKSINRNTASSGKYDNPSNLKGTDLDNWMKMTNATGDPLAEWMNRLEFNQIEIDNYLAGKQVDWKDWIYRDVALRQDYTISIAGKKENMSYYSSLNYINNQGNTIGGGYNAIRARVNLENKVAGFLIYGLNSQFTVRDEGYISRNNYYTTLSPFGNVFEEDGVTPKYYPNDNNNAQNPLISQTYTDLMDKIYNLNASIYMKAQLPLGFAIQTTYTPRFEWTNYFYSRSAEHPAYKTEGGYVQRQSTTLFYWQWDNMLTWNKKFGKHEFNFTGLLNWEKHQYWSTTGENSAFQPSDILGFHGIGFGTSPLVTSNDAYRTGSALMGRLHYVYNNRYMITTTVRRDGYSAFGQENPYAVFPSVALGWVFSEESFLDKLEWLEYGKLRLSWGRNGNRSVGQYAALMRLEPRKYFYYDQNTGELLPINTYYSYNMANSHLKWEDTESWNVGLDFSFLKGRLSGSLDIYNKKTNNLLNNRQLPSLIGYQSVISNIGEINNKGIELTLTSTNLKSRNVTWRTTFNLSYNKNTIKHLYGLMEDVKDKDGNVIGRKEADDITNGYFIGHALDEVWGYKFIGVWQENESEEAAKYNQVPGDPKLLDVDNNYKYNNDDKVFLGNTTPKVRWNMRNEFTLFQNWTLSFSMYSYLGHIKTQSRFTNSNALLNVTNSIVREYWTPENPINDYPRLKAQSPNGVSYSIYKHASFLRVDNISVGYSVPKRLLKPLKVQALNFNLTLKNAFVVSGWPAYDPENSDNITPKTLFFGLNMTL